MRAIHLCFQLHEPYELRGDFDGAMKDGLFDSEKSFKRADEEIYQPLFALLERNTQRYKAFHFSLQVSGTWLELAERYNADLVRRLRRLLGLKQVELVVEPYYHSLAYFHDQEELAAQVDLMREKTQQSLGVESKIFALPEFLYNDGIGKWAEKAGFAGVLVGGSNAALDWRSANHVYEAAGCEYLRLLFQNSKLTELVRKVDAEICAEKKVKEGEGEVQKTMLSAVRFQKMVDIECMRGELVNLYFGAEIFRNLRQDGIVVFFDELIEKWLAVGGNRLVGAMEACMLEEPTAEVSIKETVSWRDDQNDFRKEKTKKIVKQQGEQDESAQASSGDFLPMLIKKTEFRLPDWLLGGRGAEAVDALYGMRREILASEDEGLIADFRRLMAVDYQIGMNEELFVVWEKILASLKERANEVKKSQAVEISRAYTKKHDRGDVDAPRVMRAVEKMPEAKESENSGAVKVNFGPKRAGVESVKVHATGGMQQGAEVMVHRLPKAKEVEEAASEMEPESEVLVAEPKKPRGVRRIIKKLVIE